MQGVYPLEEVGLGDIVRHGADHHNGVAHLGHGRCEDIPSLTDRCSGITDEDIECSTEQGQSSKRQGMQEPQPSGLVLGAGETAENVTLDEPNSLLGAVCTTGARSLVNHASA